MDIDRMERLIRENERMRISLTNIRGYAGRSIFGGWRQQVYDMASEGLRDAGTRCGGTDIAPAPRQALRGPSPARDGAVTDRMEAARALGGVPGPQQAKVLEALASAPPNVGLTGKEIASIAGIREGSVYGCTSGMMKQRGRFWIRYDIHDLNARRWWVTERGRQALMLTDA